MRQRAQKGQLFETCLEQVRLPSQYEPRRPAHFHVEHIYLAKGSLATPERSRFVRRICDLYPETPVIECLDRPHNCIDLDEPDHLARHRKGKGTLVFGELKSAVRFSEEEGNTCPNYWHFSPYGFCPYGCRYCYLAGTNGVWYSPTVKIYVNLPGVAAEVERLARRLGKPTAFYLGKLQDGLALDPLTGYSTALVPFFAGQEHAYQVILTKGDDVDNLLGLEHRGHTILSWSLSPPEGARAFEEHTPLVEDRLEAMKKCAAAGYPLRAVLMPIIPIRGWEQTYRRFVYDLLSTVRLERLTLGGICSYRHSRSLMERKLGKHNVISEKMEAKGRPGDGRMRYPQDLRIRMYGRIIDAARQAQPDIEIALCLEERSVWDALCLAGQLGRCNCVL